MLYNVYCNEMCHLENDGSSVTVFGVMWCPQTKIKKINSDIREIKRRSGVSEAMEVKWAKISPAKVSLYKDLVNYFFDCNDLYFCGTIISNKAQLHQERCHKMQMPYHHKIYFDLLKTICSLSDSYKVYIGLKDSGSLQLVKGLCEKCHDLEDGFSGEIIQRLQLIRSNEAQLMQIISIIIGSILRESREFPSGFDGSLAKQEIVDLTKAQFACNPQKALLLREKIRFICLKSSIDS